MKKASCRKLFVYETSYVNFLNKWDNDYTFVSDTYLCNESLEIRTGYTETLRGLPAERSGSTHPRKGKIEP